MKKVNPVEYALEREIQDLLAPYPDPMGRTDFRKACRIGTRTSIYLLQIGLVPCENTGKQTRCYKIAKADVAAYLRRRLAEPAYYTPPSGWYKYYPNHKPPAFSLNGALLLTDATRQRVRHWYENLLARQPDVLDAHQIARITGYASRTVSRWCTEGRLKSFPYQHSYKVPKEWLLEFLIQQHHEEKQGALRHDRGSGAEAKKSEEKELNVTMIASTCVLDPISGHGRYPFFMLY